MIKQRSLQLEILYIIGYIKCWSWDDKLYLNGYGRSHVAHV